LTRGDRFYTQDFTPYNLTAWGFADCQRDADGYGFGSTLGRLFLRTLPNDYSVDSIYTWFPLMHPEPMEGYLKKLGKLDGYSVERPKPRGPATTVDDYVVVGEVLRSTDKFVPEYAGRAAGVIVGKGYVRRMDCRFGSLLTLPIASSPHQKMAQKSRSSLLARLLLLRKMSLTLAPTFTTRPRN
jgi:hypothetical protein